MNSNLAEQEFLAILKDSRSKLIYYVDPKTLWIYYEHRLYGKVKKLCHSFSYPTLNHLLESLGKKQCRLN